MVEGYLESVRRNGSASAICIDGKRWSYNEFHKIVLQVANAAQQCGSEYVGVYTDNDVYTYAGILGALIAGKGFVPLNQKFPDVRLQSIVSDAGIKMIFGGGQGEQRVAGFAAGVQFVRTDQLTSLADKLVTEGKGYILYTSGSTGVPKGIPITRNNFRALSTALQKRFNIQATDRVLQAFELSFDVSLACCFMAWDKGAELVVADLNGITAVNAFKAAYEQKCTFVTLPPSALFYLKRLKIVGSVVLPDVHTTLFTGEALQFAVTRDWKKCAPDSTVENAYGPTETTVWCLFDNITAATEAQTINGLCPIGDVLDGLHCRIVDDKGNDVPNETRGELWVGGEQIFHGYSNNPEKTKEVLFTDNTGMRWYKTGDIVVRNEQGNIVYVNRKDNQVQVNGYRVELGEVEFALRKVSGTDGAVVIAVDRNNVTELIAFVEGKVDQQSLNAKLAEHLPAYMIPREIRAVSALPVNSSGKIDKQKLKAEILQ